MDYKLAEELKNNGFPHYWCSKDDCSCLTNGNNSPCFPTLEDLIEACGDNGGRFTGLKHEEERWVATGYHNKKDISAMSTALTPTEAVARLWLALNKK